MTSSLKLINSNQSNECCSTKAILSETMECLSESSERVAIKRVKTPELNKQTCAIKKAPSTKSNWNSQIMKEDIIMKQSDKLVPSTQIHIKQVPVSIALPVSLITTQVQ